MKSLFINFCDFWWKKYFVLFSEKYLLSRIGIVQCLCLYVSIILKVHENVFPILLYLHSCKLYQNTFSQTLQGYSFCSLCSHVIYLKTEICKKIHFHKGNVVALVFFSCEFQIVLTRKMLFCNVYKSIVYLLLARDFQTEHHWKYISTNGFCPLYIHIWKWTAKTLYKNMASLFLKFKFNLRKSALHSWGK